MRSLSTCSGPKLQATWCERCHQSVWRGGGAVLPQCSTVSSEGNSTALAECWLRFVLAAQWLHGLLTPVLHQFWISPKVRSKCDHVLFNLRWGNATLYRTLSYFPDCVGAGGRPGPGGVAELELDFDCCFCFRPNMLSWPGCDFTSDF
jgi:hypothetical protein